jgi:epoxyqueuosine reductase
MADSALKEGIGALARELGFDLCRIARCSAPPHAAEFQAWLRAGHAGEMEWLARNAQRRIDPQQVLEGAQSVVVLGMNYQHKTPGSPGDANGPVGRVAKYAHGDDYHELIEKRLRALDEWMSSRGGRQRFYVDTGPVLERDFGALAGAGWHGKSTMLIHPKLGTWFFLAELFTTLRLPPDDPLPDRCGTCTRCLAACPTGALIAPRKLDARRCISYLTIELKGSMPLEMRPLIGDRIYGCDDCLEACPWNRFAAESREAAFAARSFLNMPLRDFLELDEVAFRALFRKSPIKRLKRRGFLRNVCVALGNIGTDADLPALRRAAGDPEPLVVEHARWAISQIELRMKPVAGKPR